MPDGLGDLLADRVHRVQRRHRLLEDHRDLVAADALHLAVAERRRGRGPRRGSGCPRGSRPGGSIRRMIESAVTDLPLPDSPTTPSVWPASSSKSTPSTARIEPRARCGTRSAGSRPAAAQPCAPHGVGGSSGRARRAHGDVPLDGGHQASSWSPDWSALEQLAVLDRDAVEIGRSRPKRKKYARMRGAMLRQTCVVCGCPERESTNSWKRMSASTQRSRSSVRRRLPHQPHLLGELAEVGVGHPLEPPS